MDIAKSSRNSGIDFFRLFSIFLVVLLHTVTAFIVKAGVRNLSFSWFVLCFLFYASNCCVNCFALISGYLGVNKANSASKIIWLWVRVLLGGVYSCVFLCVFYPNAFTPTQITEFWIQSVFPILANEYWYFTAYVPLFFLAPYYNQLVESMTKKQHIKLMIVLLIIFSVVPTIVKTDVFLGGSGGSFLWLSVMYFLGAYIKKYGIFQNASRYLCLLLYFLCVGVQIAFAAFKAEVTRSNLSPLTVCSAVLLLLFFEKKSFSKNNQKVLAKLAPLSFGIFLVHTHRPIWAIIENSKPFLSLPSSPILTFCKVLVLAVVIFVGSGVVEFILSKFIVLLQRCCSCISKKQKNT